MSSQIRSIQRNALRMELKKHNKGNKYLASAWHLLRSKYLSKRDKKIIMNNIDSI